MKHMVTVVAGLWLLAGGAGCGTTMSVPRATFTSAAVRPCAEEAVTQTADASLTIEVRGVVRNRNRFPVVVDLRDPRLSVAGTPVAAEVQNYSPVGGWIRPRAHTNYVVSLKVPKDAFVAASGPAGRAAAAVAIQLQGYLQFWDYGYTPLTGGTPWGIVRRFRYEGALTP